MTLDEITALHNRATASLLALAETAAAVAAELEAEELDEEPADAT